VIAVSAWLSLDWWLLKLDMLPFLDAAKIYILTLVVDSISSHLRDSILGALLQQKLAQLSLVIRNLVFLIALSILVYKGEVNLAYVVAAQLLASIISVLISLTGLWRYLKLTDVTQKSDWIAPKWSQMWAVAKDMYFSGLVGQVYSPHVFTLIIRYNLGEETTAIFGFLRNLFMQVLNYLPATLLFGLIRPKLVASYVGDGGIAELTRNANIVGKVSLFVLMPLLVFTWLTSEELVAQFSCNKFPHSGYYLAGFFCALVPFSQRQILETVTVVTGNSHLCNYAAFLGIFTVPIAYGLMQMDFGLWAPIIAFILGHLIFCSTIVRGVEKRNNYRADFLGYYKMLLAAFIGYLGSNLVIIPGQGLVWIIAVAILASCAFLLAAAIIKPFSDDERLRINKLIKRNVFIW
jgi:O-antigen/teichoic acid export membrane protein